MQATISETPIAMSELKDELGKIKKRDKEINFRMGKVEEYLNPFQPLPKAKSAQLAEKLQKLNVPRMKDIHICKIVDLMPKTVEELKVILQGYTITVSNDNIKKVADVVKDYAN